LPEGLEVSSPAISASLRLWFEFFSSLEEEANRPPPHIAPRYPESHPSPPSNPSTRLIHAPFPAKNLDPPTIPPFSPVRLPCRILPGQGIGIKSARKKMYAPIKFNVLTAELYSKALLELGISSEQSLELISLMHSTKPSCRICMLEANSNDFRRLLTLWNLPFYVSREVFHVNKNIYADTSSRVSGEGLSRAVEIYVAQDELIARSLAKAFAKRNHRFIGELLGYPSCCVSFFCANYALGDSLNMNFSKLTKASKTPNLLITEGYGKSRHKLISHFPCADNCKESIEIAKINLEVIEGLSLFSEFKHKP